MTKEERHRFDGICDDVAGLKKEVESHAKLIEKQTEAINKLNETLNNGIIRQVELIWKEIEKFHREKLEVMKKQLEFQENGNDRRKSIWKKMNWWQKIAAISGLLVIMAPYIKNFIVALLEMFGITIEFPE